MAGIHVDTCPYCFTKNVAFVARQSFVTKAHEKRAFFLCGCCGEGVIWEYVSPPGTAASPTDANGDLSRAHILVGRRWPEMATGEAPESTPDNVAHFFKQATDSLHNGSFDAAGMMFRKSLESATKAIDPQASHLTLFKRLQKLVENHLITPALGEWANEIRLGGNEAAHDDEIFSREDAQALRDFTENFLRYAFTLPAAVARRAAPVEHG
ncbi:hypothetical protein CAF53_11075 [Sphingobium sp. LB126]|uniref:DUF4145 domain-containing protein n=1 Tax=Sphingobium sp. LB126 TaxID=1983755 RepID=UPI000C201A3D|nr:DUF4145 domain-containing protein [Sphingobium sp. LB126]PJG48716.1 hypothetical protein CAF53_11075 [Sphingobium sp. LB126]